MVTVTSFPKVFARQHVGMGIEGILSLPSKQGVFKPPSEALVLATAKAGNFEVCQHSCWD